MCWELLATQKSLLGSLVEQNLELWTYSSDKIVCWELLVRKIEVTPIASFSFNHNGRFTLKESKHIFREKDPFPKKIAWQYLITVIIKTNFP